MDESAPIRGKLRRINIEEATGTCYTGCIIIVGQEGYLVMFTKLKNRWNNITDFSSDELPKVFSKEWFLFILVIGAILAFMTLFVFITGDKAGDIIIMLASWGFFFVLGVLWGIQKTEKAHREAEKQKQIEEEYKRIHNP